MIPFTRAVDYLRIPSAIEFSSTDKENSEFTDNDSERFLTLRRYGFMVLILSNALLFAFSIRNLAVSTEKCANKSRTVRDMLKETSLYCRYSLQ